MHDIAIGAAVAISVFSLTIKSSSRRALMKDPVVLITGALTGIGRATALAFANEGGRIVASGRRDAEGQALVAELRKLGAEAEFLRSDVRHEDDVRSLVDKTVARFGRLDVAVNTAGTEGKPGPVTAQSAESYAATFDTNVLGTLLSMKHELRVMLAQGSGSIVNVSSTYGRTGGAGASKSDPVSLDTDLTNHQGDQGGRDGEEGAEADGSAGGGAGGQRGRGTP